MYETFNLKQYVDFAAIANEISKQAPQGKRTIQKDFNDSSVLRALIVSTFEVELIEAIIINEINQRKKLKDDTKCRNSSI